MEEDLNGLNKYKFIYRVFFWYAVKPCPVGTKMYFGERYSTQFEGTKMCSRHLENESQLGNGCYLENL